MKNCSLRFLLSILLLALITPGFAQDCDNDVTPPVPICLVGLTAALDSGTGEATIWAADIDEGSYDECGAVTLALSDTDAMEPTTTESLTFGETGTFNIILWATDESDNYDACWTYVTIYDAADCDTDVVPPVAVCEDELVVALPDFGSATVFAADLDNGSYDLCSAVDFRISPTGATTTPPAETSMTFFVEGTYATTLWVLDVSGNWNSCNSSIVVLDWNTGGQDCDNDVTPPVTVCQDGLVAALNSGTGEVTIWATDIDEGSYDACSAVTLALSDIDATEPTTTASLTFEETGTFDIILWATDESGNYNACWTQVIIYDAADCDTDVVPPVAVCEDEVIVALPDFGEATIFAADLDNGSYDLCSAVDFRISEAGATTTPPAEISMSISVEGTYPVTLWVLDAAGNWNSCNTSIVAISWNGGGGQDCDNDIIAPIAVCNDAATVSLSDNGEFILYADAIDEGSWDQCGVVSLLIESGNVSATPPPTTSITFTEPGVETIFLWAVDEAGNTNVCWSEITILDSGQNCEGDTEAPVPYCLNGLQVALSGFDNTATVWAVDILTDATDNCSVLFNYGIEPGSGSAEPPTAQSLLFDTPGTYVVTVWVGDEAGNWDFCTANLIITPSNDPTKRISGSVFQDENASCSYDASEAYLEGWEVQFVPYINGIQDGSAAIIGYTLADGTYELDFSENFLASADSFAVQLGLSMNLTETCPLSYTLYPADFVGVSEINQDFAVVLEEDCYAMQVDISAPLLRRCLESYYVINYCNYGGETAEDAYVEVTLDDYIDYSSSSIPYSSVDGNTYTFLLGDIAPGECGFFNVFVVVSCDALLGQAHCSEAHIYPDKPCGHSYTGAIIEVEGRCDEDTEEVHFTIRNVGDEDMQVAKDYFVVEDVIMYMQNPFNLGSGDHTDIILPGNGSTYRLEAEQPDEYPWLGLVGAAVEGCGTDGNGDVSLGIVTQFSTLEAGPFIAVDCQENIGSYDPNDKQASPKGIGEEHLLRENTPIDYKIRFQNTGTDTAFNVVILDTLSEWLDINTVRPGASSHPYTFQMLAGNVLEFRFDNIMLPDSNINQQASNGFIQFKVDQLPDNAHGTLIENNAAIYFDFNEPIITNTVFHTIGELAITATTSPTASNQLPLKIYPNPFSEQATFKLPITTTKGTFLLYQMDGRKVLQETFRGSDFELNASQLNGSGLYFFEIMTAEGATYHGKLMAK